jgi:hypothetical protein
MPGVFLFLFLKTPPLAARRAPAACRIDRRLLAALRCAHARQQPSGCWLAELSTDADALLATAPVGGGARAATAGGGEASRPTPRLQLWAWGGGELFARNPRLVVDRPAGSFGVASQTSRIHLGPFGMHHRVFCPFLVATYGILILVMWAAAGCGSFRLAGRVKKGGGTSVVQTQSVFTRGELWRGGKGGVGWACVCMWWTLE